jgi:hypothetical protein
MTMNKLTGRRVRVPLFVTLLLIVLGGSAMYLFRQREFDNAALGYTTVEYRWGRPRVLQVDSDRDGVADARYLLQPDERIPSPHSRFSEGWESSRCDGIMDLHLRFAGSGDLTFVEFDSNRDGKYDLVEHRADAVSFIRTLQRPMGCSGSRSQNPLTPSD